MSLICDYIRANPNWLEELTAYPYNLSITREDRFVRFNATNRSEEDVPLVNEAKRNLIVDLNTIEPVCWPLRENSAIEIAVWRDSKDEWHISDCFDIFSSHRDMYVNEYGLNFSTLKPEFVHIFSVGFYDLWKVGLIDQKTGEIIER